MSMQWTDDLSTGVDRIDDQHKELFDRFRLLEDACLRQKGIEEIRHYMDFLTEYVVFHFAAEEQEMAACSYPGLQSHRQEHAQFKKEISALNNEICVTGARVTLVHTALWASLEWLTDHVKGTDRQMAAYLTKEMP